MIKKFQSLNNFILSMDKCSQSKANEACNSSMQEGLLYQNLIERLFK